MESVGTQLRAERLRQGLSLNALSIKTRIPLKNLEAVEEDAPARIGNAFFYRSFARQIAQMLKMNYGELAPAVDQMAASLGDPPLHHYVKDPMLPKIEPLEPMQSKKARWIVSAAALIGVLFACSGLYGMWEDARSGNSASASAQQVSLHRAAN